MIKKYLTKNEVTNIVLKILSENIQINKNSIQLNNILQFDLRLDDLDYVVIPSMLEDFLYEKYKIDCFLNDIIQELLRRSITVNDLIENIFDKLKVIINVHNNI